MSCRKPLFGLVQTRRQTVLPGFEPRFGPEPGRLNSPLGSNQFMSAPGSFQQSASIVFRLHGIIHDLTSSAACCR